MTNCENLLPLVQLKTGTRTRLKNTTHCAAGLILVLKLHELSGELASHLSGWREYARKGKTNEPGILARHVLIILQDDEWQFSDSK